VVPEGNDPSMSKLFDMFMMIFPDGRERTEAEYRKLLSAGGFTLRSVTPTLSPVPSWRRLAHHADFLPAWSAVMVRGD
jgi:hypothetical protein